MTDKRFENIKILISIQKCTPVRNFSHFVELQIMTPNLSHKMSDKNFEKINIKTEISIQQSNTLKKFKFWDQIYPQNMNEKNFEKNKH